MTQDGTIRTGRMKIGNDWPGIFIRGDDALSYASKLRRLFAEAEKRANELSQDELMAWARVEELAALFAASLTVRLRPTRRRHD
jgi:hypothetical protein